MRGFFHFICATIFYLTFFLFINLTTFRFQLLDADFLIKIFRQTDTYSTAERELKALAKDSLAKEFEKKGGGVENLTAAQKKDAENEIDKIITSEKIQDLIEVNITRFLEFVNGNEKELLLYLPIQKWKLPQNISSQKPYSLMSENTQLEMILDTNQTLKAKEQLANIRNIVGKIKDAWIITGVLLIILLITHYLLSTRPGKIKPTARLIIKTGISIVLSSGLVLFASRELINKIPRNHPVQILIISIIPTLILEIIKLYLLIAIALIIIGVLILHLTSFFLKRKKIQHSSLAPQVQKR